MKKTITVILAILVISAISVTAFAANYQTVAEIVSGVTGKTADQVAAERNSGKTYGEIAAESGKLNEFKTAKEALIKERLDALVKEGKLTQAEADKIFTHYQARTALCDGTGAGTGGCGLGNGYNGYGNGNGNGCGMGGGRRMGRGNGFGTFSSAVNS